MSQLLDYCKANQATIVKTLGELVMMESFTTDKAKVDKLGKRIKAQADSLGAKVDIFPDSSVGDSMLASFGNGPTQILVICHFDTVWPSGTTSNRPFTVEDGVATGPGVLDMKAGIAITLHALQAIQDLDIKLNKTVKVIFNTDEELESSSSRFLIEREAKKSKFVLCLEPSFGKAGAIKTTRKGTGAFDLKITGRAAHAGNDPENGISAIDELAHQILKLKDIANIPIGTTITVGVVNGGTVRNQVAPYANALIDVRVPTLSEGNRVTKAILGLTPNTPGAEISVSGRIERLPMERTEAVASLFKKTTNIALGMGIELQEAKLVGGGSDGQLAAALGIPVLDGLGGVGEGPHADTEYVLVDSLPERAALLAALLTDL